MDRLTRTKAFKWTANERARSIERPAPADMMGCLTVEEAEKARRFHRTFTDYAETPLTSLPGLATHLGVAGIYVKDESYRFGLNAFKVLGGAYAIGMYLAERLGREISELSFDVLRSPEVKVMLGELTFITATDGNHGRGVAWAAQQLGQQAIVYMPKGSSRIRLDNIRATGAEAYITEWNYDECVRHCAKLAKERGWIVIQDTAWEGYEKIPSWIMQGYATLALEAMDQLEAYGAGKPTHLFLQAGVGSFAGAVQGLFAGACGDERPVTAVVEPNKADCLFRSAAAGDGRPRFVTGDMDTIMAGLACGEPNPAAWDVLHEYTDMFISCPDYVAANGMRILGNPIGQDKPVISGESGAVTAGALSLLMTRPELAEAKERLGLNANSHVLLISTEGDTDPEHYRRIVWDGHYPAEN
ncbi:diaminopropionate ammonia-lyase [Paenibacillus stellifer]|uniref:Diaminopropionate ammonia-lyase n=1 Tax=Paenibacillus stellifer TaxID=169760 RepID=A0A089LW85_9BACL|nr:diaminopropionate ammonia-lyase [Paenibacillus stellifer]AIQ63488.1 diaminopropionate ammonia-lyase [Paenibacillus stellifer]